MRTTSRPRMVRRHDVTNIPEPTESSRHRAPHRPAVPSLPPRKKNHDTDASRPRLTLPTPPSPKPSPKQR